MRMDTKVAEKIDLFFKQFKHQVYKKAEILIRADDNPAGIFYLTKGNVREYAISKKGDELVLNVFKPISFFPMNWVINDTHNIYFFEAMTEVEVWRAPKEDTLMFIKNNPDVLFDLMSRVYKGVDGMLLRMSYLMTGSAYDRLITELLIQAKRFALNKKVASNLEIKVTEKDLATQAGLTRETVSREMKRLKEKGIVTLNKNVLVIKNLVKLEEELGNF
jgi:CRP-like cAMP-binding protein